MHIEIVTHTKRHTYRHRDTNTHRLTHILARHPSECKLPVRPDTSCPPSPVSQPGKPSAERADLRVRSVAGLGLAPRVSSSLSGSSRSQPAGNLAVKDQAEPPRPRPPLPSPRPHLQAFPSGERLPAPAGLAQDPLPQAGSKLCTWPCSKAKPCPLRTPVLHHPKPGHLWRDGDRGEVLGAQNPRRCRS